MDIYIQIKNMDAPFIWILWINQLLLTFWII